MSETRKPPTLADYLVRSEGRDLERRLETARYYAGIDLGTTNSSVTLVDALALLRGDTEEAVRVLPIRQHTSRGVRESPLLPSVVAEVEPGGWWVGRGAHEARNRVHRPGQEAIERCSSTLPCPSVMAGHSYHVPRAGWEQTAN